jgi:hypothetical protein
MYKFAISATSMRGQIRRATALLRRCPNVVASAVILQTGMHQRKMAATGLASAMRLLSEAARKGDILAPHTARNVKRPFTGLLAYWRKDGR